MTRRFAPQGPRLLAWLDSVPRYRLQPRHPFSHANAMHRTDGVPAVGFEHQDSQLTLAPSLSLALAVGITSVQTWAATSSKDKT